MNTLEVAIKADRARDGAGRFVASTEKMAQGATKADRKIRTLDRSLTKMGSTAKSVIGPMTGLFAGFTAIAGIRGAISAMGQFEQTMAIVKGVSGATGDEFVSITEKAKELGATTRFSATQAGEGMLFLARAGFTVEQNLAAIQPTLRFAQANMMDLGTSADIVSNIMTQFGINATETARATDVLTMTANSANTDVLQLAEGMKFVGPVAGQLSLTLEETAAAMGVLGNAGIQSSMAGTSLRAIMLSLISPTGEAEKAITGLNIAMEDLNPSTNSLAEIMNVLKDAQLGVKDANEIFGRRAIAAGLQLTDLTEVLEALTQGNLDAAGAVEKIANLMDDTLIGAAKNVASAMEAVALSTGDKGVLGGLKKLLNVISDTIRLMLGMEQAITGNTEAAKNLAAILITISGILGVIIAQKMIIWFELLTAAIATAAIAAGPLVLALIGIAAALAVLRIGVWFVKEFKIAQTAWVQFETFIGIGVEGLKLIFNTLTTIVNVAFNELFDGITNKFGDFLEFLADKVEAINTLPFVNLDTVQSTLTSAADMAKNLLPDRDLKQELTELVTDYKGSLAQLEAAEALALAKIEEDFKGKDRKGNTLTATIAADFKRVRDAILGVFVTPIDLNVNSPSDPGAPTGPKQAEEDVRRLTGAMKLLNDISVDVGDTMARGLEDAIVATKSLSEAMKALAQDVARLVVREAVTKPLSGGITSFLQDFAKTAFAPQAAVAGPQVSSGPASLQDFGLQFGNSGFQPHQSMFEAPRTANQLSLNFTNNSSQPLQPSRAEMSFDSVGRQYIVDVIVDDMNSGGDISNSIGARA